MNIISRTGDQIVSVAEAKANSRVTHSAEDSMWELWVNAAHEHVEKSTGLVLQQSICTQDVFNVCDVDLNAPVRGIISVLDANGTDVDYKTHKTSAFGLNVNFSTTGQVTVKYIAGFGDYAATGTEVAVNEGDISAYATAKAAVLVLTNHFYENRGVVSDFQKYELPVGLKNMLDLDTKYR